MFNKKSISELIITTMLIIIIVFGVIYFQNWNISYQSSITNSIETNKDSINQISYEKIIKNSIYLKSSNNEQIKSLKILDQQGIKKCSFDYQNANGLVGYWSMDKKNSTHVFDESGNENHGKYSNLLFENGIKSKSAYFNGNSLITIGKKEIFNGSSGLTYSVWIKRDGNSTYRWPHIIRHGDTHRYYGIRIHEWGSHINIEYGFEPYNGSTYAGTTFLIVKDKQWDNYIYTYNKTKINTYLNGELIFSQNTLGFNNDFGEIDIGFNYKGNIDEVRLYNRSLNEMEIKNLYNFNEIELNLNEGINEINFNNCNLSKNENYEIIIFTENNKIEEKIYFK